MSAGGAAAGAAGTLLFRWKKEGLFCGAATAEGVCSTTTGTEHHMPEHIFKTHTVRARTHVALVSLPEVACREPLAYSVQTGTYLVLGRGGPPQGGHPRARRRGYNGGSKFNSEHTREGGEKRRGRKDEQLKCSMRIIASAAGGRFGGVGNAPARAAGCGGGATRVSASGAEAGPSESLSSLASLCSSCCDTATTRCSCCWCLPSRMHWMRLAASPSVSIGAICHPRPGQRVGFICVAPQG